jgi:hypothetical protein
MEHQIKGPTWNWYAPFVRECIKSVYVRHFWCTNLKMTWFNYISFCDFLEVHSYKHNEQIKNQNIDNSKCFGVKIFKIYPEMTS